MAKRKQASRRRGKAEPQKKDARQIPPVTDFFPIVGVGASAGGLEALERLLKPLPGNTGMAFVLVQHLDPKHKSLLTQILSRASSMTVAEVRDGVEVQPNHVYIIPPTQTCSSRMASCG